MPLTLTSMTSPTNRWASAFAVQEAMVKRFTAQHPCAYPLVLMCYLPHNRTATVMPRQADSSAPNLSSVGSHPQSPPAPRTQGRGEYAPNSLSSAAQSCGVLANDAAMRSAVRTTNSPFHRSRADAAPHGVRPARPGRAHREVLFHPVCLAPSLGPRANSHKRLSFRHLSGKQRSAVSQEQNLHSARRTIVCRMID